MSTYHGFKHTCVKDSVFTRIEGNPAYCENITAEQFRSDIRSGKLTKVEAEK